MVRGPDDVGDVPNLDGAVPVGIQVDLFHELIGPLVVVSDAYCGLTGAPGGHPVRQSRANAQQDAFPRHRPLRRL